MAKRILITGSEGNIGKVLVPYVKNVPNYNYVLRLGRRKIYADDYVLCDITNLNDLFIYFKEFKPDIIIHLSAMVSRVSCERSPATTINTNVVGTNNLIQLCKQYNARMIFFSTSEIYGNISGVLDESRKDICPNNLYGVSKLIGEQLIQYEMTNGLDAVIIRPFMLYNENEDFGANHSAMIRFAEALVKKEKITVHKHSCRSWMHVSDAVRVIYASLDGDVKLFNMGNPEIVETSKLARIMCDKLGLDYDKYVIEEDQPNKMTLSKLPALDRQNELGVDLEINLDKGIDLVLNKVKERIYAGNHNL